MNKPDLTLLETVIEKIVTPCSFNVLIAVCGTEGTPENYKKTRRLVDSALTHLEKEGMLNAWNNGDELMYSLKPVNALELLRVEFPLNYALATAPKPTKTTTLYNWNNAPAWAMWASVDTDGCAEWHETMPYYSTARSFWVPTDGQVKALFSSDILHSLAAPDSLEKRPWGK